MSGINFFYICRPFLKNGVGAYVLHTCKTVTSLAVKMSLPNLSRGVAQPGSALAWGASGRRFKSCHPDRVKKPPFRRLSLFLQVLSKFSRLHLEMACIKFSHTALFFFYYHFKVRRFRERIEYVLNKFSWRSKFTLFYIHPCTIHG